MSGSVQVGSTGNDKRGRAEIAAHDVFEVGLRIPILIERVLAIFEFFFKSAALTF
jgi:hypothetical protein